MTTEHVHEPGPTKGSVTRCLSCRVVMRCEVVVDLKPPTPCGKPAPGLIGDDDALIPACRKHTAKWGSFDPLMVIFRNPEWAIREVTP